MAWSKTLKARYIALTDMMAVHGSNIGMPHTRAMGDGLFEMRIKDQDNIARVLYCTQKDKNIVVLHAFIKKTQQTPKKEIEIAKNRAKEVKRNG
jgi:phage-related protein